jgi:hypothetical protein
MGWVVNATRRPIYPREKPGTHCVEGWVGPRAGLDVRGKFRPPPEFDPRTVHPVASRYTYRAIAAHIQIPLSTKIYENVFILFKNNSCTPF